MNAIDYVIRTRAGVIVRGVVGNTEGVSVIDSGPGSDISLNLMQDQIRGYDRVGSDLVISLVDGRVIVLENYFSSAPEDQNQLYISSDGVLNEVSFLEAENGSMMAQYGPTQTLGMNAEFDPLIFIGHSIGDGAAMAGGALLGAAALGLGALGLATGAFGGGSDDDGGGGNDGTNTNTNYQVNSSYAGGSNPALTVTGTAPANASVLVTVGGQQLTTTAGADGTWSVVFTGGTLPADGTYTDIPVVITPQGGGTINVVGPTVVIDTTGPAISFTSGTQSAGDMWNTSEISSNNGVTITGSGEPGANLVITVTGPTQSDTQNVTVAQDGTWSMNVSTTVLPDGEYNANLSIVGTDAYGNTTVTSDTVVIDTVAHTITIDNVTGDKLINSTEAASGFSITGTVAGTSSAGSMVTVSFGTFSKQAIVQQDGTWSVSVLPSEVPANGQILSVTATTSDAAGNQSSANTTFAVDTVNQLSLTNAPLTGDNVINAQELSSGFVLTGSTDSGASVSVNIGGVIRTTTADGSGVWSVTFENGSLPTGTYNQTAVITSTDPAGNVSTLNHAFSVDTDPGILTISSTPVEGDDIINAAEASNGVILTGTADPNVMVTVVLGGVSHVVQANSSGIWSAPFTAGEIPAGTYTAQITATITDSAGNSLTRTDSVQVDTQITNFTTNTPIEGDNVINATEASDGFTLTGTVEAGGTVSLTFGSTTVNAVVDGLGNWSASFPASTIAAGEYNTSLVVNATDAAGNTASSTVNFAVDTAVNTLTENFFADLGDGVVNATEAQSGVTLTGTVEVGSAVVVTLNGITHNATVQSNGSWSVAIPSSSIPTGTQPNVELVVTATDAAGNVRTISPNVTIDIDTEVPGTLDFLFNSTNTVVINGIVTETATDLVGINQLITSGASPQVSAVDISSTSPGLGGTIHTFTNQVDAGTSFVVTQTDTAGNMSGSLFVTEDGATNTVQMSDQIANALGSYGVEAIDLSVAQDSQLTITEAQILALSQTTDTVMVKGGVDDAVTITGAQLTGTQTVGTDVYNVYTLGSATVLLDDEITNVTVV